MPKETGMRPPPLSCTSTALFWSEANDRGTKLHLLFLTSEWNIKSVMWKSETWAILFVF